ncbi:hypothetical protein ACFLZT_02780, partial [Thermodesulfobacteriota bacterium]
PGVTTAADIITALGTVIQFTAVAAEGSTTGVINTASASTGLTGGPIPPAQIDTRRWISLKAEVGGVEFVGIDGITVQAENLMVAVNQSSGLNAYDP